MKCPGNPAEHKGIIAIKLPDVDTHYAKIVCKVCGERIRWVGKRESYRLSNEERGCVEELAETDVARMERCILDAGKIVAEVYSGERDFAFRDILKIAFELFRREGK